jgi:phosphoglycolate phosphatase
VVASDSRRGPAPSLLLFDIDGTLLQKASREHAIALYEALKSVHGVDSNGLEPPSSAAGRTDGEIARLLLQAAGMEDAGIDAGAADVAAECCRIYADRSCPSDLSTHVVPGMPSLLKQLSDRDDIRLGLVTGNYEQVAQTKLDAAGLLSFFQPWVGGFGSDSEDRFDLPPLARRRAGSPGAPWARERTVVIGDTPRDIACARADVLRVIAVTTGPYEASELREADAVAEDAVQLAAALEHVIG